MQINLTPDPSLLAIMVIFLLNYLIVKKFFLQPINEILERRAERSRTADSAYEKAMEQLDAATQDIDQKLQVTRRQAAEIRDRHRNEAAAYRQSLIDQANAETRRKLNEAVGKIEDEVTSAKKDIEQSSEQLARLAAQELLGRPLEKRS